MGESVEVKMAGAPKGMLKLGCSMERPVWDEMHQDEVMWDLLQARWDVDPLFRRILRESLRQRVHLVHHERSGSKSYWGGGVRDGVIVGQIKPISSIRSASSSTRIS